MITDNELRIYFVGKEWEKLSIWECRNIVEEALVFFVKSKKEKPISLLHELAMAFGLASEVTPTKSFLSETHYEILEFYGLISHNRKKVTTKGQMYYNQLIPN